MLSSQGPEPHLDKSFPKKPQERNSTTFDYRELVGKRTIRLLKFLPGLTPSCSLISVDINKAPPYMALSYTWGSQTFEDHILVDGYSMPITKNLGNALRRLHKYARANHLMLWVDSICIDQGNLHERSHQVGFMNAIYRCAESVGVWLGEAQTDCDLLMEKMENWRIEYERLAETWDGNHQLAVASILPSNNLFYGPHGSIEHRAWMALNALLERDWWRRAWIVQEATVLGPSRTFLFCGESLVPWSALRAALQIGHHVSRYETQLGMSLDFDQCMGVRLDEFRAMRESGAYVRLLEVLQFIRAFECRDPRDKVYASLGIAADVLDNDIIPDYTKSVEAVFTDVVKFGLSQPGPSSLDFFGLVVRPSMDLFGVDFLSSNDELPSWVPDLRMRCSLKAFEKYLLTDDFDSKRAYNVAGDHSGTTKVEGRCLYTHGFVLDTVSKCWPVCNKNLDESGVNIERSWKPDDGRIPYVFGGTISEAFNHTLLADIGRRDISSDILERGVSMDWDLVNRDTLDMTPEEKTRRSNILVDLKMTTYGRRLLETEGGCIGLGPAAAEVCDKVCVFFGGQLLYMLRERESSDQFEFIGECYIHGAMDKLVLDGFPQREFVIS